MKQFPRQAKAVLWYSVTITVINVTTIWWYGYMNVYFIYLIRNDDDHWMLIILLPKCKPNIFPYPTGLPQ